MESNGTRDETKVQYHMRRFKELVSKRSSWESTWAELGEYIEPTRLRLSDREGPGSRKKITDGTATRALQTLASGMHSGITSPARPWFKLGTDDPDIKDHSEVKNYLSTVEIRMRQVFAGSSIYNAFHQGYSDLGQFGQAVSLLVEDEATTVRMISLLHGTFWIARDEAGMATTLYRKFYWSVQKIVTRFGYANCSLPVQQAFDQSRYDDRHWVYHAIEPRLTRNKLKTDKKNKPFLSNYWEDRHDFNSKLLEESGFDQNPIIAPGWQIAGDDDYSVSPGMVALGDVKMLQMEQTRKLEAIDKMVRPPMTGPTSMMNNPASLLPGSVTYVDDPSGKGFRPAMEVNIRLGELRDDILDGRNNIREAFYADLFLMLANMEGIQPRNTLEIAERKEEKLLALGPVLENIYNGALEPVIDRTYQIMLMRGDLPPPPDVLQGREFKIEYISILAQAQKAVGTGAIERGLAFVGNLAGMKPEALDKIDADKATDEYFDALGVPPAMIVPDDKVKELREQRAAALEQERQAAMASTMAPAAKQGAEAARLLSEIDTGPSGSAKLQQIGMI